MIIEYNVPYSIVAHIATANASNTFIDPGVKEVYGNVVAAFLNEIPAAYAIFIPESTTGHWSIPSLAVDKELHGRGIMKYLLTNAFKRLECKKVMLEVHPDNSPARKLYKNLGFKETDGGLVKYADGKSAIFCDLFL